MVHARPFWTSTLWELFNETKDTPMRRYLTPQIELWVFGSPGGLHFPTFGSVSCIFTLSPKEGLRQVVCKPVWMNEACQLVLVPSWSSNMPFYPWKCCELRSVPRLPSLPLSSTWTHIWILRGVGSASVGQHSIVEFAQSYLKGYALTWWRIVKQGEGKTHGHTWEFFKECIKL